MSRAILRKISGFFTVTESVIGLFNDICKDRVEYAPGTILAGQGGEYGDVLMIDSGWVIRSRYMENGSRQIVNVAVPGDFVALNALLFTTSDFELRTKTSVLGFRFEPMALRNALLSEPSLSAALFWVNCHEESILSERIVSLGRRSARARIAHVLCEFIARLEIIGIDDAEMMALPISQEEFSDILGISVVHTNKTLRAMDRDGILTFRNEMLVIADRARLEREAGFDGGYLHFTRRGDGQNWAPAALLVD